uniref:Uncharacterized protein n=1 Tax=virus sp. ctML55 TaxID=2827627 RepID=A0A8S5RHJ4_9VIRU|nr:MAG TPA: hypothetical protein [virus sp. ctML55]
MLRNSLQNPPNLQVLQLSLGLNNLKKKVIRERCFLF